MVKLLYIYIYIYIYIHKTPPGSRRSHFIPKMTGTNKKREVLVREGETSAGNWEANLVTLTSTSSSALLPLAMLGFYFHVYLRGSVDRCLLSTWTGRHPWTDTGVQFKQKVGQNDHYY